MDPFTSPVTSVIRLPISVMSSLAWWFIAPVVSMAIGVKMLLLLLLLLFFFFCARSPARSLQAKNCKLGVTSEMAHSLAQKLFGCESVSERYFISSLQ